MKAQKRVAKPAEKPATPQGTYKYQVSLKHPITRADFRQPFTTTKDEAYAFADVIASRSVVVDIKRIRTVSK
jgi:hypothetical protein